MIETLIERLENGLDLREVTNPTGMRIGLALQVNCDTEGVAVQTPTFVTFRDVRKAVGRFECKFLEDFHGIESLERWRSPGEKCRWRVYQQWFDESQHAPHLKTMSLKVRSSIVWIDFYSKRGIPKLFISLMNELSAPCCGNIICSPCLKSIGVELS